MSGSIFANVRPLGASVGPRPSVTVYRAVDHRLEVCSLGEEHSVEVIVAKVLGPVVDEVNTIVGGSGEYTLSEVREDRQGRRYTIHHVVDFHGAPTWHREDGVRFHGSVHRAKRGPSSVAVNQHGEVLPN